MAPPTVFTDRTQALDLAISLANVGDQLETQIGVLLDISAGTWTNPAAPTVPVTVYRPYFAVAHAMLQSAKYQQILQASGVTFTGMANPVYSHFKVQESIDKSYSLTVPDGMAVPERYSVEGQGKGLVIAIPAQTVQSIRTS